VELWHKPLFQPLLHPLSPALSREGRGGKYDVCVSPTNIFDGLTFSQVVTPTFHQLLRQLFINFKSCYAKLLRQLLRQVLQRLPGAMSVPLKFAMNCRWFAIHCSLIFRLEEHRIIKVWGVRRCRRPSHAVHPMTQSRWHRPGRGVPACPLSGGVRLGAIAAQRLGLPLCPRLQPVRRLYAM